MSERRYEPTPKISRELAESILAKNDPSEVPQALIGITYHEPDWHWVQNQLIHFAQDSDANVRRVAALCFGYLARIHRVVDREKVFPILKKLSKDPNDDVAEEAQWTLKDIKFILRQTRNRKE